VGYDEGHLESRSSIIPIIYLIATNLSEIGDIGGYLGI
jgi:hypothetical protein